MGFQMRSIARLNKLEKRLWNASSNARSKSQFKLDLEEVIHRVAVAGIPCCSSNGTWNNLKFLPVQTGCDSFF
jgi:hypothetical protein